jgi:hypothetical protein
MSNPDQIAEQKKQIIEELEKAPIVLAVCQRVGVSRTTFYRWLKDDIAFAETVETAKREGVHTINDLAESKLIANIKNGDNTAIIYWLKHNHLKYEEAYLGLSPILQKQLVNLFDRDEEGMLKHIFNLIVTQKVSMRMANRLISVMEKLFKAKSVSKKKKEYEVLRSLITNSSLN